MGLALVSSDTTRSDPAVWIPPRYSSPSDDRLMELMRMVSSHPFGVVVGAAQVAPASVL